MVELSEITFRITSVFCIVPLVPQMLTCPNYIDPGTGSLIIQILIGSFFGGLFLLKAYWGKVSAFLSRMSSKIKKRN